MATEIGIVTLHDPAIREGDVYPFRHMYKNGEVRDEARVTRTDEYLALLEPVSSKLNTVRFLRYPLAQKEELYVGLLDEEGDAQYLPAERLHQGAHGDLVLCRELEKYPEALEGRGYGGVGLFAYRDGYHWLAGLLTPLRAQVRGVAGMVYPFVPIERFLEFIPELKDQFNRERKPFRPDFEYGVNRDGSGE